MKLKGHAVDPPKQTEDEKYLSDDFYRYLQS